MAGLSDNTPGNSRNQTLATFGWSLLIIATLFVCYFSHLGAIGFVGPDEPRYAWIARAMAETGDWVTPRLYGQPWFEKPPLYYWGAALSFRLFGVSEAAARLPSALSALLGTLALAWLAWRLYDAETARWLLLLLPTTVGMIGFSHAAATDMPFSAMLTIAMVAAALILRLVPTQAAASSADIPDIRCRGAAPLRSIQHELTGHEIPAPEALPPASADPPALANEILFGFFLGLAVLAKGPAAIILCGGAVFFWALITKRWRDAFRLLHPVAILTFCVTALPWYILCARRNPDFFRVFIIEHNFKRYLTPEFQHIQPFWFYGPILLLAFLPWTALALWSAFVAFERASRKQRMSDGSLFFMTWAIFWVLFFSISKSKLPGYILPAIPALMMLVTHSILAIKVEKRRYLALTTLIPSLLLGLCFALSGVVSLHFSRVNPNLVLDVGLLLAVLSVTNLLMSAEFSFSPDRTYPGLLAACGVLPVLVALVFAGSFLRSFLPSDASGKSIANELRLRNIPIDKLAVEGMNRGKHYSLNFYLHQEVKDWDKNDASEKFVISSSASCAVWAPAVSRCEPIPFYAEKFLFRVRSSSLRDAAGGRQPQ